jgi:hypothetical protein
MKTERRSTTKPQERSHRKLTCVFQKISSNRDYNLVRAKVLQLMSSALRLLNA